MKLAIAAFLALSATAVPAMANNGGCVFPEASQSVVYLGDPCDLIEPEVIEAEEVANTDPNSALVDAYGMPTSVPVVMRPSMDAAPVSASAEPVATPAAETAPAKEAPAGDTAEVKEEATPEASGEQPAPQTSAPAENNNNGGGSGANTVN